MKIEIEIDNRVIRVMSVLREKDFEVYLVGGSVRDLLIGRKPKDWDICTSAMPQEVIEIFSERREKVIETGIKHGTVTVLADDLPLEVTTFRTEGRYTDSRRPDNVNFNATLMEDLSRRDFTMNAIACSGETDKKGSDDKTEIRQKYNLVDPFNGVEDIQNKLIRAVGDPEDRIKEDPLRLLRALRFASVYSFTIDDYLCRAIKKHRNLLHNISAERINSEFTRMLCGDGIEQILNKYREVIAVFIPEIIPMFDFDQRNRYHCLDVWRHTVKSVAEAKKDRTVRLAMFFHDIGKPSCWSYDAETKAGHFYGHAKVGAEMTRKIMRRLKYDNITRSDVCELIYYHDSRPQNRKVLRMLNKLGERRYRKLLDVQEADVKAQSPEYIDAKLNYLSSIRRELEQIIEEKKCFRISDLAVDGKDLIDAGIPQGSQIGRILKKILREVIDGNLTNDKKELLEAALEWFREEGADDDQ